MEAEIEVELDLTIDEPEKEVTQDQLDQIFKPITVKEVYDKKINYRTIKIPPNRLSPLKNQWMEIYKPLVEFLKLQVRFNTKTLNVEIRTSALTQDIGALQKAADYVRAFVLGFQIADALALLRLEDLFVESFSIDDVKQTLQGDHVSRAIGRLAGKDGKTKFTVENSTRTRIVLADKKIHILGTYQNIAVARHALCSLILGSPPGKVYGRLKLQAARLQEK